MATLRRAGYHAITLRTAVRAWRRGAPLPRRPIVLTFDDGYRSDYTHARPVLMRLGWPGVLNLALENVEPGGITAPEVRSLIAAGWEIDSHTLTHPDLTTLPASELRHQVVDSRAQIRWRFRPAGGLLLLPLRPLRRSRRGRRARRRLPSGDNRR